MNLSEEQSEIIVLKKENETLRQAVRELSALNEIASAIDSTDSVDSIINLIVHKCIKHLEVEQCVVQLLHKNESSSEFQTMIRKADETKFNISFRLDSQLCGWMIHNKKPLLINDFSKERKFVVHEGEGIPFKSLLCTPMVVKGELIGLISVFNKKNDELFTENDKRLLTIISSQSASVLENARLYEEEQKLFSMQEEMRLAREIQLNLLPKKISDIEGFDIAAKSIPAKEVGGDYYDFIDTSDNRVAFCLGDITGKGLPAAMLVSNLQATLRGQLINNIDTGECVTNSNNLLYHSTEKDKFATLFLGIFEKQKGNKIIFSNAGHDRPVKINKSGELSLIKPAGVILGALPDINYEQEEENFEPGDTLVIYSDGITEAMNESDEEFTLDRLKEILKNNFELPANSLLNKIIHEVKNHTGKAAQSDDITLIIIKKIQ